ncbi:protoheme IX farnesyltransferase 2 [Alicyclobacillus cellulosilyticus]|uniref:Protoheme IX farnesyltransferase n=1 Tax=Alicyclobacillus cellulosilyticus TaxID=1003997 RepID=A0A917K747_9BACL|nr:heme o synthase [Alicyclobacillus cellulosilyticus]GGJ01468.1 protoheme IX farnesyltransferase 2 [Alicyclobacillus cellulosilyticus]
MGARSLAMGSGTEAVVAEQRTWRHVVSQCRDLVSLTKVGITVANLMATFAGYWVGCHGHPQWGSLVWTLLGAALVVAAGATLNNYIDRDIDDRMERTKTRALVTGKVSPQTALWFGVSLGVAGTAVLALGVNLTAAACGLAGLVMYAYVYTVWLKRTTTLSTVLGGAAGAAPPLLGWAGGSGGSLGLSAWVLFTVFFLWQPPHFLPLAMRRSEEYRAAGIPMLPVVRGFVETKVQILLYTVAMVVTSWFLYLLGDENVLYLLTVLVLGVGYVYQAVRGLFVTDDLAWAAKVFRYSLIYLTVLCVALVLGVVR